MSSEQRCLARAPGLLAPGSRPGSSLFLPLLTSSPPLSIPLPPFCCTGASAPPLPCSPSLLRTCDVSSSPDGSKSSSYLCSILLHYPLAQTNGDSGWDDIINRCMAKSLKRISHQSIKMIILLHHLLSHQNRGGEGILQHRKEQYQLLLED